MVKTHQKFLDDCFDTHGDKFDYSNVVYNTSCDKVEIICPKHGSFWQTPIGHINSKLGCPKCKGDENSKRQVLTLDNFIARSNKTHGEKYDYSKSVYINGRTKILITCPEHGDFYQNPNSHLFGKGCMRCSKTNTKPEQKIEEFLIRMGEVVIKNNRSLIKPQELDFMIPAKKIAIEFDGLYYHSEKRDIGKLYHLDKTLNCEKNGYRLIHIFEDEYSNFKLVRDKLQTILKNDIILEEFDIKDVPVEMAKRFKTKYNFSWYNFECDRCVGTYYKNRLVELVSFKNEQVTNICKIGKFSTSYGVENIIKDFASSAILDRRWDDSNFYKNLGFVLVETLPPRAWDALWYKQRSDIVTEKSNKIWDCGNSVYVKSFLTKYISRLNNLE